MSAVKSENVFLVLVEYKQQYLTTIVIQQRVFVVTIYPFIHEMVHPSYIIVVNDSKEHTYTTKFCNTVHKYHWVLISFKKALIECSFDSLTTIIHDGWTISWMKGYIIIIIKILRFTRCANLNTIIKMLRNELYTLTLSKS